MEGFHSNSKMAKFLKANLENVDPHLNSTSSSPLLRYLCAQSQSQSQPPSPIDALKQRRRNLSPRSPLSPVENLMQRSPSPSVVFRTPAAEEVLVMDGVLLTGGGGRSSSRSASDFSSSSDSSGKKTLYKTDLFAISRFAHGKEKLRPTRCPVKNKSELQMCKSYIGTGSCRPNPKSRFVHQVMESSVTEAAAATKQGASLTTLKSTIKTPTATISFVDWSPQDDGIEVVLSPHSSTGTGTPPLRKDVDSYITDVLYGPTTRRRFQVFAEIFPE